MGGTSGARHDMCVALTQLLLFWWFVESGMCCLEHVHPGNCSCQPFGQTYKRIIVTCRRIQQIPRDLPSNTVILKLSGNHLSAIQEDVFRNLTLLGKIDLSMNSLKSIPLNTFQNLTHLSSINLDDNNIKAAFHLPENVKQVTMRNNMLSLDELKVIVGKSKRIISLDITGNPIGPLLTSNTFDGFDRMLFLYMASCGLKHIENGTFRSMKELTVFDLSYNMLTCINPETLEGPSNKLTNLNLAYNAIAVIGDGTFTRFSMLRELNLKNNSFTSAPDLTGINMLTHLYLEYDQIRDISPLGDSKIKSVFQLSLKFNQVDHLPVHIFQNLSVRVYLDFSFNNLRSLPNEAFSGCKDLSMLVLNFNNISQMTNRTLAGLHNLRILMMIKNRIAFIPQGTFADTPLLELMFLHGNAIKRIDGTAFRGLSGLRTLTLFENPLSSLPVKMFEDMASNVTLLISCKNFRELSPGMYTAKIKCAPSASFQVIVEKSEHLFLDGLRYSGFRCTRYKPRIHMDWYNCSICMTGTKSNLADWCLKCPAGGFYQDEMGQIECKICSTGTYVPEKDHPGKSATDCRACPYGTRSNDTAGYRACRCLNNFYRLDRFGPCSACPDYGFDCFNDTAILAPNYFWIWRNQTMINYKKFVENLHTFGADYNKTFSTFQGPLPNPQKCPYSGSCKGGISSACNVGYQGTLCATCSYNHYLRFNSCLQCPSMEVTIISCLAVLMVFALLFLMVLWGDSRRIEDDHTRTCAYVNRRTEGDRPRTVADVIMSCAKIVIGFYQVVAGIFSALVRVQWPIILISLEKYLKFVEGNILQFAPLSCIHPLLRLDPILQFVLAVAINILVVSLILLYLYLKKRRINKINIFRSEKFEKISALKKSCYRNIFLFLLLSYPVTSKKIIDILPLPGACVDMCFTKNDCISLLKADYSFHCFTDRHNAFWHIAAAFSLYPVVFPLLLLFPIRKYRYANPEKKEIAFGLRVFFENYEDKYWFWEILEMYRKLILISVILLFDSQSRSQIGFAVIAASASGIAYTIFRPIRSKFEDRLQTFVLWIIFFNVCLGAIYSQPDIRSSQGGRNNSIFVNVMFVVLNSAVLILAVGKGVIYLKSFWRKVSHCPKQCYHLICRGCRKCCSHGNNDNVPLVQQTDELVYLLE